jgi:hypothetical protein
MYNSKLDLPPVMAYNIQTLGKFPEDYTLILTPQRKSKNYNGCDGFEGQVG